MESIRTAVIIEKDTPNLYRELFHIYQELKSHGVATPELRRSEHREWGNHHITVLLRLKRRLRQKNLHLLEWEEWVKDHENRYGNIFTQPEVKEPIETGKAGLRKNQLQRNLEQLIPRIEHARSAENAARLFLVIKGLYSQLYKHGIKMPLILSPADDPWWYDYHRYYLFRLHQKILERKFNSDSWNREIEIVDKGHRKEVESAPAQESLERRMLKFMFEELKKRPVTTTSVICHEPFLNVDPRKLEQAFLFLRNAEYIRATGNEMQYTVNEITGKGIRVLGAEL